LVFLASLLNGIREVVVVCDWMPCFGVVV